MQPLPSLLPPPMCRGHASVKIKEDQQQPLLADNPDGGGSALLRGITPVSVDIRRTTSRGDKGGKPGVSFIADPGCIF